MPARIARAPTFLASKDDIDTLVPSNNIIDIPCLTRMALTPPCLTRMALAPPCLTRMALTPPCLTRMALTPPCLATITLLALCLLSPVTCQQVCYSQLCLPSDYDKFTIPHNGGDYVHILVKNNLVGVFGVDVMKGVVSIKTWLSMTWRDDQVNLTTSTSQIGETTNQIPYVSEYGENVWIPDLYIWNLVSQRKMPVVRPHEVVHVWREDDHTWLMYGFNLDFGVYCKMDFQRYPFDVQICIVSYSSPKYWSTYINFTFDHDQTLSRMYPEADLQDYYLSTEELDQEEKTFNHEGHDYSHAGYKLVLRRKYTKQIIMYFLPSTMFVISSWSSFLMPPEFPGRTALLVTLFLVIVSILISVIDTTPSGGSGLSAINIWILASLFFVFISFVEYIFVLASRRFYKNSAVQDVKMNGVCRKWDADNVMLILSPISFVIFNVFYWINI